MKPTFLNEYMQQAENRGNRCEDNIKEEEWEGV